MSAADWTLTLGAQPQSGAVRFRLWAPASERVDVVLYGPDAESVHALRPEGNGYFAGRVEGAGPGTRYKFRPDGGEAYPDPASRSQPDGVHGASEVWDPGAYRWSDAGWRGRTADELVIYELHVGTFTRQGTFRAAAERLGELAALGVTAVELMPIASFPGERNWGYDGVDLYAPAAAYGTPDDFKALVDAAHAHGLAVILDVVYNHFGPEGNYLPALTGGRFFTGRHKTPWGDAINYDGSDSRPVRDLVIQNALYWVHEYHVDGLRLDATHAIVDDSPVHLLQELAATVKAAVARPVTVIAEDERNERRLVLPAEEGGYGLDAVWADDLHHQLRRLTAGDEEGYFASYSGTIADVVATLQKGWFYEGQRSPHRGEARGTPAAGLPPRAFVHCLQNHDQVGNRALGTRLSQDVAPEVYRAASALLLLSPYTPLLWMGQEWAASAPFLYFTDHPPELGALVTQGRREEFKHFSAFHDPEQRERIPDPQAPETFQRSRLNWEERERPPHAGVLRLYTDLLALRRQLPPVDRAGFRAFALGPTALGLRRAGPDGGELLLVAGFGGELALGLAERPETAPPAGGEWRLRLSTEEPRYGGAGEGSVLERGALRLPGPGAVVLTAQGTGES